MLGFCWRLRCSLVSLSLAITSGSIISYGSFSCGGRLSHCKRCAIPSTPSTPPTAATVRSSATMTATATARCGFGLLARGILGHLIPIQLQVHGHYEHQCRDCRWAARAARLTCAERGPLLTRESLLSADSLIVLSPGI